MVHWTDAERHIIADVWGKINHDEIGVQALARLLIVFPWNQRYFSSLGNLSNAAAVLGSPKLVAHGKVVVRGLDKAVNNMDNVKGTYTQLSALHFDELHMDPSNFTLLCDCYTICLAANFGPSVFTPEVHVTWQKLMDVVVDAMCKQ